MGLYQRVRPKTFDEVFGNEAAVAALRRAVSSERRAHAYLLSGPSGCGKTTLARIAAREFGCAEMNIHEINAASSRGIDMARELERRTLSAPLGGGNRAIILDEAHSLTRDASNALLKVLEDIPDWCYYFLCTTEPAKLLPTIRTRCEPIEVRPLSEEQLLELLVSVIERGEASDPGDDVLDEIATNANGCPRRALVLLEQVDGLPEDQALKLVRSYEASEREVIDLCRAVLKGQWQEAVKVFKGLPDRDPEKIRRAILGYLRGALLKARKTADAILLVEKIEELTEPTYDSGEAGLLAMIFRACRVETA